jgi:large subunit ribosomal protein L10
VDWQYCQSILQQGKCWIFHTAQTERRRSVNRTEKAELIETLQTAFNGATTIVVAHQVGMTVAESGDLRQKMRDTEAGFKVTKNRIAKLALKGTRFESLDSLFAGPTAVGMSKDPVAAAKTLVDYSRGNAKLTIVGGSIDGKILDIAGVEALAKLPSLDELRGTLVGLIQAPAAKIARVTQAPASKLARVIKAREDQLQQGA